MAYATRDGMRMYYEQAGTGSPALVFVHGWCCDHTFFEPQYEHFRTSSSVTTYDLRGCGASDRPDDNDVATLADDLAWLCSELGISKSVLVGHSLGGDVVVELAARHPSVPRAVVAVDPGAFDPLPENREALTELVETLEDPARDDPRPAYVASLFQPRDDLGRAQRISETMCAVPRSIAAAQLRGYLRWDGRSALAACAAPLLVLIRKTGGSNDPSRLLALKPDIHVGVTVGAGHFHQLDAADQVTPMIERFIRDVL